MLKKNRQPNSHCAFAAEIVSYLYGECSFDEKKTFENHLNSCASCNKEFAGFGAVRASVIEWRNEEFLPLDKPLIKIPRSKMPEISQPKSVPAITKNWFEEIQRIFSLSPAAGAIAVCAIFVVCLGTVFFANKTARNSDVAELHTENLERAESPQELTKNDIPERRNVAVEKKTDGEKSPIQNSRLTLADEEKNLPVNTFKSPDTSKKAVVKVSVEAKNSVKNSIRAANLPNVKTPDSNIKKPAFAQTHSLPRLNNAEEEEDKSLRLADLLDDDAK